MNNRQLLGKRIKEIRKSCNFTQEKLSELVEIETNTLSRIESGRHFPSLITLEKIAEVLSVEMKDFFEFKHLVSDKEMKAKIIKNIDEMDKKTLTFIYKLFEIYK